MSANLFKSFIKSPKNTTYGGEDSDENVEILLRKSLFTIIPMAVASVILLAVPFILSHPVSIAGSVFKVQPNKEILFLATAFWYLFTLGFVFQGFLNWFFEVMLITNKKIVDIDQGCRNISETSLEKIQDITSNMNKGMGEVLNIGMIFLQTAGETEEFEFGPVDNPSVIRDTISDLVIKGKQNGIK